MRRPTRVLFALLAFGVAAGCASTGSTPVRLTDHEVAMVIRVANEGEVRIAESAAARVTDVKAREFAAMMVRDHTAAAERAAALFRVRNLVPAESAASNQLREAASSETHAVTAAGGTDADRAYVDGQVRLHRDLLRLIDDTLYPAARDQDLRDFLTNMRVSVAAHLGHAETIARGLPR